MFIRTFRELQQLGRIRWPMHNDTFRSARFLTAADGMGFSYNANRAKQGIDTIIWLKHHWEANYIIAGQLQVTDLTSEESWSLGAGDLYVVGPNDRHRFVVTKDTSYISIFCPPLRGDEGFDKDGGYEASGPIAKTDRRMFVKRASEMRRRGKEVIAANGLARAPMLTKADDVGFGLSYVRFEGGTDTTLWSKHHWEANHVTSGVGKLTDLATGQTWPIEGSMSYNVGPKDRHCVRAHTTLQLVSIVAPPLAGDERYDADGALAPSGPVPPGPAGY